MQAAVQAALSEPLRDSVRNAAERAAKEPAGGAKKKREPQITQTPFGMDVTEVMPLMEAMGARQRGDAEAKKPRRDDAASAKARKACESIAKACANLHAKKDAGKLSISDLITLIKWKGGIVPADTSKNNKPALVQIWEDLAVPDQAIRAEASSAAAEPADEPSLAATEKKKQKRRAAESDDESDSEEEESDEEEDEGSDDEGSDAGLMFERSNAFHPSLGG